MAGFSDLPMFENFDDGEVYKRDERYIFQAEAQNFVIEFDMDKAIAALNLPAASIKELLDAKVGIFSEATYPPMKGFPG